MPTYDKNYSGSTSFPVGDFREAHLIINDDGCIWQPTNKYARNSWLKCLMGYQLIVGFGKAPVNFIIFIPFRNRSHKCGLKPHLSNPAEHRFWQQITENACNLEQRKFMVKYAYMPIDATADRLSQLCNSLTSDRESSSKYSSVS